MKNNFSYKNFIEKILEFSPRQLEKERETANFIVNFLKERGIAVKKEEFATTVPETKKASLLVDGEEVSCQNCGLYSGKIDRDNIVSSMLPSSCFNEKSNINFNPRCEKEISCNNFYFATALAVERKDIPVIIKGKEVEGVTEVSPVKHRSLNILVGNLKNPKNICFAHYDSVNKGAVDNASGVAVITKLILDNPETLQDTLYVYSGNEEVSYDKPTYWGHGFRAFEKKHYEIMNKAKKIMVIDSLGNGPTIKTEDPSLLFLGFPIKNLEKWKSKISVIAGDINLLMKVYHSDADDLDQINEKYLEEGASLLLDTINS